MGGGSGSDWAIERKDLERLEQIAKEKLRETTGRAKHNVFISFAAEDLNDVNLLRGQAKNENSDLEFNDWSLREPFDSTKAEYIRRGIRERIRQSSVTIVYVSEHTADSRWVNWEVRESIALGKAVIALHKGDRPPARLPQAVVENNVPVVPWSQKSIMAAIEQSKNKPPTERP